MTKSIHCVTLESITAKCCKMADEEKEEELFADAIVEFTTNSEYITNSYWAISAVQELDPMTAEGRAMKNRILTRCFKIIDMCVEEMYSELFDPSADD